MGLRAAVRDRFYRAVDDVVGRHRAEQNRELRVQLEECVRAEVDRVVAELRAVEIRDRRDTLAAAERLAVASTARFVQQEMRRSRHFPYPHETLEHALAIAPREGMALEFGVFTGATLRLIAASRPGAVYGFDSFAGLPENWRAGFDVGTFGEADPPEVPGAELVVGLFADTLPGFLVGHPGTVALLHVDADLYSSASCVLHHVGPRLAPGSVVVFDEFFNYPCWEQHEARAWQEYVVEHGVAFHYEAYTVDSEQVVVQID